MGPQMQKICTKCISKYFQYISLKFYVMTNVFECFGKLMFWNLFLVQNWHVPYFLHHLFTFRNSSRARIVSILCTCFHIKLLFFFFFESVTFTRITRRAEQELSFKVIAPAPTYLLWKMWIRVLRILDFGVYFSPEAVSQSLSKNNPTENKICRNSDDTETCTSSKTYRGENVLEAIATSYKTKLQVNICLL